MSDGKRSSKTSKVWMHFSEKDSEKRVKCLHCSKGLSISNRSTYSLIRHLKAKHPTLGIIPTSKAPDIDKSQVDDTSNANSSKLLVTRRSMQLKSEPIYLDENIDKSDDDDFVDIFEEEDSVEEATRLSVPETAVIDNANLNTSSDSEAYNDGVNAINIKNETTSNQSRELNKAYDAFAKYVALQLRLLPRKNAIYVQTKVQQILAEEQMNVLEESGK